MSKYLEIFTDKERVFEKFEGKTWDYDSNCETRDERPEYPIVDKDINILLAFYEYEDYSGSAFVLFEKNGKLFEVNGGHCSCYGLEGQWNPEETTKEALLHRIKEGKLGYDTWSEKNSFKDELLEVLNSL